MTQHRETALFTEKFADWKRPNQDQLLTPIHHRDSNHHDSKTTKLRTLNCDLTQDNQQVEIKSGLYNIVNGNGDFVDERDGRILTISTDSYKKMTAGPNGRLIDFERDTLNQNDVILLIWTYRISGTGRWAGKQMRENKKRPPPQGDSRTLVMLWGGQDASEVALGEAALLATQSRLGPLFRVEYGMEPDCFTKAWNGRLIINCDNEATKLYLCLGQTKEAFYLQQVEHDHSAIRDNLSLMISNPDGSVSFKSGQNPAYYDHYKKPNEMPFTLAAKSKFCKNQIEKMFKIERVLDQLIPVQLKTVNRPANYRFVQNQLKGIVLILTTTTVYLWHEENEEEGNCVFYFSTDFFKTFELNF